MGLFTRTFSVALGAFLVAAAGISGAAKAEVLNFDSMGVAPISSDYGDTAEIDVSYNGFAFGGGRLTSTPLGIPYTHTTGIYPGLSRILYLAGFNSVAEGNDAAMVISFAPEAEYGVTISSLDVGLYNDVPTKLEIWDMDMSTMLYTTGPMSAPSAHTEHLDTGDISSDTGLKIVFGPNANMNALDNIVYSSYAITSSGDTDGNASEIPLPATLPLMAMGLALGGRMAARH